MCLAFVEERFPYVRGFCFKDKGMPVAVSLFMIYFFIELHFESAKMSVIMSLGLIFRERVQACAKIMDSRAFCPGQYVTDKKPIHA